MQKAPWLALGALARFRAGEHVIGRRQNFGGASRRRPQRAKGFYQGQINVSVQRRRRLRCADFVFGILIRAKSHYVKPVSEPEIILIAGPTASGKSALALALAEKLRGVDHQCRLHAGLPRPAHHHRAADARGGAARAAPCSTAASTRRRIIPSDAGARTQPRRSRRRRRYGARRDRRRRHRALFQCADARACRRAADPAEIREAVRARLASDGVAALHAELQSTRSGRGGAADARRSRPHHPRAGSGAGDRPFAAGLARGRQRRRALDAGARRKDLSHARSRRAVAPDRCALRRHDRGGRARGSAGAGRAQPRSRICRR